MGKALIYTPIFLGVFHKNLGLPHSQATLWMASYPVLVNSALVDDVEGILLFVRVPRVEVFRDGFVNERLHLLHVS